MSVRSITGRGRRRFEARVFTDWCRVTAPGEGPRLWDEETGQYTDPPRAVVYEGPCRLQVKVDINSNIVETTAGEREWSYMTSHLQVPVVGTEAIRPDNVAEMVECVEDPTVEGRLFNIQGLYHKSHSVNRRFRVRELIA